MLKGAAVLDAFIESLRAVRAQDIDAYQVPQEPTWPKQDFEQYRLQWKPSTPRPTEPLLKLEDVRDRIVDRILEYVEGNTSPMLLLRVPPGVGKTTASVVAAQQYVSRSTRRVLYTASRRNFFAELQLIHGFRRVFWWNWLPLMSEDPVTCQYGLEMMLWLAKGYKSFDMCRQLCMYNGHINECPYRKQRYRAEPIIFGRHAHLIHGMAIDDYDLGICDEVPVSAFLETKRIPPESVLVPGLEGTLHELVYRLYQFTQSHQRLYGHDLLSLTADLVGNVYDEIDVGGVHLPDVPPLHSADDVTKASYFYVFDLLTTLSREYECYRNGWERWVPRVSVGEHGIAIYGRNSVQEMWSETDIPLVLLDATGSAALYRRLFGRSVIEFAPQVERKGRIFQIVNRLNGMGTVCQRVSPRKTQLTKNGRELLQTCELIAAEYSGRVGVITFKRVEKQFKAIFGDDNVLHYGALRGSNILQTCDCLILAGGYCPNLIGLQYIAAALNPRRMKPFYALDDEGRPINPWTQEERPYRLREPDSRGVPVRQIRGYWRDPDLNVLLEEYRQNEIEQAIHRNRPVNKECDVWILTNIPTPEPLDDIFESLSDLPFTPSREKVGATNYWGITIPHWYKIKEKLDGEWCQEGTVITTAMLAEATGVSKSTIEHDRWVPALLALCDRTGRPWEAQAIRYTGKGRRPSIQKKMNCTGVTTRLEGTTIL